MPNADLLQPAGTELWSRAGASLGAKAVRRFGRTRSAELRETC
jgi:hypothetical protein